MLKLPTLLAAKFMLSVTKIFLPIFSNVFLGLHCQIWFLPKKHEKENCDLLISPNMRSKILLTIRRNAGAEANNFKPMILKFQFVQ